MEGPWFADVIHAYTGCGKGGGKPGAMTRDGRRTGSGVGRVFARSLVRGEWSKKQIHMSLLHSSRPEVVKIDLTFQRNQLFALVCLQPVS